MGVKIFLSLIFIIVALSLLILYWFLPLSNSEFFVQNTGSGVSLVNSSAAKQFYESMRFPDKRISYKIYDCPIAKKEDMLRAFSIMENKTILNFYPIQKNEEVSVYCDSQQKVEGGLFIAGEGGPSNITKAGEFNVITKGKILLFRESDCLNPNIAIHELLHVLGFDHVNNSNDIMYAISKCGQEINPQTIDEINTLYSIPSLPDVAFENVSANMKGKYLNLNMSLRNVGFRDSSNSYIEILADNKTIKRTELGPLKFGHGRYIYLTNVWINQISVKEIRLVVEYPSQELRTDNNEVILRVVE